MDRQNPANNKNDNDDDERIRQKILVLCSMHVNESSSSTAAGGFRHEALLCAALLWTRIQDDKVFCKIAMTNENVNNTPSTRILVPFVSHLLKQLDSSYSQRRSGNDGADETSFHPQLELLARLAVQILTRLHRLLPEGFGSDTASSAAQDTSEQRPLQEEHRCCMWSILRHRRELGMPIEPLDLELLGAMHVSLSSAMPEVELERSLLELWDLYEASMAHRPEPQDQQTLPYSQCSSSNDNDDATLMLTTLHALLEQTSGSTDSDKNRSMEEEWHETIWEVFHQQQYVAAKNSGTVRERFSLKLWVKELSWWTKHKQAATASIRVRWTWLILHTLDWMAQQKTTNNAEANLLDETNASSMVTLLLAAVVSPNQEISALHPLAWAVACNQWKPLLDKLGLDRQMCSLLKLAVGEWNIQLENSLCISTKNSAPVNETMNSSKEDHEGLLALLTPCGQIVTQTIEWLGQLDEETDRDSAAKDEMSRNKVTKSSIKHVRQSLELALDLCVQFFQLDDENALPRDIAALVSTVFGSLLTEFDVFTHKLSKREESSEDSKEASISLIQTLGKCMAIAAEGPTPHQQPLNFLIPAVTTVLASAQGDPKRENLLRNQCENVVALVGAFWQMKDHNDTELVWTCQLIELFSDMFPLPEPAADEWKNYLVEAMKSHAGNGTISRPALQSVLGCYVVLQGEDPPEGSEAEVIHSTLSRLSSVR